MASTPASQTLRPDALPPRLVATVWLPFAAAYFMSYALRNVNAVLAPELTREFALSAAELGLLTSVYYISFSLVQLPFGILLDRYGSRRVHATLLLVAAAGSVLHATGNSFVLVATGRALIGIGVALGLMSAVKAFAQWFPLSRVPLAINMMMAFGNLGAMVAAGPVGWSLAYISWRTVFWISAALFVLASILLFVVMPEKRQAQESWSQLAGGFGTIFRSASFWRLSLMMSVISGTYTAIQSLWIGPWLRDAAGLDRAQVLVVITWLAVASIIGYAVVGAGCDWLIRRGARALTLYKIQAGSAMVVLSIIVFFGGSTALVLWLVYFAVGSGGPLVLAILARRFPAGIAGRVNTATNVLIFSIAFGFQWGVGAVLDRWPVTDGRYAVEGYQAAFIGLILVQLAFYVLLLWKEHPTPLPEGRAAEAPGTRAFKAPGA